MKLLDVIKRFIEMPDQKWECLCRVRRTWHREKDPEARGVLEGEMLGIVRPELMFGDLDGELLDLTDEQAGFGERLRAARMRAKLSQTDLAKVSKVPQPHLSRLENGLFRPTTRMIWKLAEALHMTPAELVGRKGISSSFELPDSDEPN